MEGQEVRIDHRKLPWKGIWKAIAEKESVRRGKKVSPEAVRMGVQGKSEYYLQLYHQEIQKRKAYLHCNERDI
ncbi:MULTISPECIES: hypothetical protein [Prosthecochloris]|uniref:Uncharacterized protein n=1 Tax=Prosthecochloris marina TaxID=2017681 RepID=A0A317T4V3_9CHLB|nr:MULTISPECIES: hypothetical protein [Prosthecochloris]PWW81654.1 hypothetical protein CR164_09615 [Prosthecochloris marina]UZJ37102.1 hypothetical protein OO005_10135 [Prosthecochloris sp. SCSIO W1103]UZJ40080.1 hypothetical protein OO185_02975 [Prosthecochloris sp. SCSIO W1102]